MSENSRLLKIIIAGVVVLTAVLVLVFVVGGGEDTNDASSSGDDNQAVQTRSWQSNSEIRQTLLDLGFVCDRQTYASLSFGDDETEANLLAKMTAAGIAEAELELCDDEATGIIFGSGLSEDIDALYGVYSDYRCETGEDDFLGLSDGTTGFLVDGIYYISNQPGDTEALRGVLDDLGVDYTENDIALRDCES